MRFYLDENINHIVQKRLAKAGVDVLTAQYAKMHRRSDQVQLAYAHELQRVIVTGDEDFKDLAQKVCEHSGIVYVYAPAVPASMLAEKLLKMHQEISPESMIGVLITIPPY